MKKILFLSVILLFIIYIIIFPAYAVSAAANGLVIWFNQLLPVLLPSGILSSILLSSGIITDITSRFRWYKPHYYPVIAGFLLGFPIGSMIVGDMARSQLLDENHAKRLLYLCNNISPAFINGYILTSCLHRPDLAVLTFCCIYSPPVFLYLMQTLFAKDAMSNIKNAAPRSQINFKIIDAGIMNGFETLTRLGGYIIMFAMLANIVTLFPIPSEHIKCLLVGITEITNGINYINASSLPWKDKYILITACTTFGGISGIAQTMSMIKGSKLSIKNYILVKTLCALMTAFLAFLLITYLLPE